MHNLKTIRDFIRFAATQFARADLHFGHGTDNPMDEARWLVLSALKLNYNLPDLYLSAHLTDDEQTTLRAMLKERVETHRPTAYLVNEAWFAGLKFHVNDHVLVPRSPLAEFIQKRCSPWFETRDPLRILDLCTGSGCIGIACAYTFPTAQVDLADISTDALAVCETNIANHGLQDRVRAIHSDLFDALVGEKYDIIISNPPYVPSEEYQSLPAEFHREPVLGLEAGADGLDCAIPILEQAAHFLSPNGLLVVEVGSAAPALLDSFPEIPFQWLEFDNGGEGVFALTAQQLFSNPIMLDMPIDNIVLSNVAPPAEPLSNPPSNAAPAAEELLRPLPDAVPPAEELFDPLSAQPQEQPVYAARTSVELDEQPVEILFDPRKR